MAKRRTSYATTVVREPPRIPVDYPTVFAHAPDAMLVVSEEGRYIDANLAAEELTGYTRDELLSLRVGDLTIPDEREVSAQRFKVLRSEGRSRKERTIQRKDGDRVSVEAHAVRLSDNTFLTTLRDITERKEQEQALADSLSAFETLHDLCGAAVMSADQFGKISSWNSSAGDLFGYSQEQALGMHIERLMTEPYLDQHRKRFASFLDRQPGTRFRRTFEAVGRRADGSEVPIEITLGAGWQGDTPRFTAVVRDITEQRMTLARLNSALETLQFHIKRMPLAHIVWDCDFRVQEWNPAAERIFGFSRKEAVGKHAYDLVVPKDVVPTVEKVWADLLAGDTSSHSINFNVRKDATLLTCEWFNTPLRDAQGNVRGVASMAMDVTERELVEQRLRDAQKLESLGVLAGGVAHDFNNTLMVILGNSSLLRSIKSLPANAVQFIEMIEDAGLRASELIRHLLAYARTGRHNPEPTDLSAVVQDAHLFLQSSVGKDFEVKLELDDKLPLVRVDRSQMDQILLNLCVNAGQAMRESGTITIETRPIRLDTSAVRRVTQFSLRPGDYVELAVSDDGDGMDKATKQRIFDPFFTTKREGHGLGLAAVSGILRQHGAGARVDSSPGKGTAFHIYFPVDQRGDEFEASGQFEGA